MKRLLEIEDDYDFSLLGISCHARDYRLSWELNNCLNIELEKSESIFLSDEEEASGFSTMTFVDDENYCTFTLISNKQQGKVLIPESPQLDYFLKVSGPQHEQDIIKYKQMVQNIDLVLAALEIDLKSLKSKPNLVF